MHRAFRKVFRMRCNNEHNTWGKRPNGDSSALLVMKAHQQNTWKTFIFRSLDFCYAITVPQDQKASLLQPVEFYWLVKGQKRAQGIGSEGLL
jgi:hypothetical protein